MSTVLPFASVRLFDPGTECLTLNQAVDYVKNGMKGTYVPPPAKAPGLPRDPFYVAVEHAVTCDACAERIRRLKKTFRPQPEYVEMH